MCKCSYFIKLFYSHWCSYANPISVSKDLMKTKIEEMPFSLSSCSLLDFIQPLNPDSRKGKCTQTCFPNWSPQMIHTENTSCHNHNSVTSVRIRLIITCQEIFIRGGLLKRPHLVSERRQIVLVEFALGNPFHDSPLSGMTCDLSC